MKPILLATDGSPSAEGATREAIDLARAYEAPLIVVSVAHVVRPVLRWLLRLRRDRRRPPRGREQHVTQILAETKERAAKAGVTCATIGLEGLVGEQICKVAHDRDPRLVVIGAHGWGRVGRLLHGSVSTYVLHHAACPVLVVHGDDPSCRRQGRRCGRRAS